ncbi:MAG TPA: hypothetical protein VLS88_02970 [Polyangiales bacterium]|nr:hypothetical protein [Polyangiales bacterium]
MSALGRAIGSKGIFIMYQQQEINRIINRAKQQRAEYLASFTRSHPVSLALVAALSLVLLQFTSLPSGESGEQAELTRQVSQLG